MTIRILIADDHTIFRAALREFLEKEMDFKVVGEAGNGPETLKLAEKGGYDVLLLDISMPGGLSASAIAEEIIRKSTDIAIVVLTMYEDEYYVKELLKIGVKGFVLKKSSSTALINSIRFAHRKKIYLDPSLSQYLLPSYLGYDDNNKKDRLNSLTHREQEVCSLLASGHTSAEIAEKLFLSVRTIETHRANIMEKLELKTRAELVRFAIDNGLLKLNTP